MWSKTFLLQYIWFYGTQTGHNRTDMDLTPEQIEEIERALNKLETLDPAELPEPAAELVALLSEILDETESG